MHSVVVGEEGAAALLIGGDGGVFDWCENLLYHCASSGDGGALRRTRGCV